MTTSSELLRILEAFEFEYNQAEEAYYSFEAAYDAKPNVTNKKQFETAAKRLDVAEDRWQKQVEATVGTQWCESLI